MFHSFRSQFTRTATISLLMVSMLFFFTAPRPAEAFIFVPTNDLTLNISKWTDLGKVFGLDGLAYMAAQAVLDQINTSIVNWIKGGSNGNPLYITDLNNYLNNIGYQAQQDYINQLNQSNTCYSSGAQTSGGTWINPDTGQPFQPGTSGGNTWINPDTGQPFQPGDIFGTQRSYYSAPTCPFSDGQSFQSIPQNGWGGYLSATLDPGTSPLAENVTGRQAMAYNAYVKQQQALQEAQWNNGYLSQKDCSSGNCVTKTPGSLLASQLNFSLQSGTRRLELADKINEMVLAVMTNAIDNLANKGIGLFNNAILNALPGGVSSAINRATGGNPLQGIQNGINKINNMPGQLQSNTNPYQNPSNTNVSGSSSGSPSSNQIVQPAPIGV